MSKNVICRLKIIHVEHYYGSRFIRFHSFNIFPYYRYGCLPVQKPRKRVCMSQMGKLDFAFFLLVYIHYEHVCKNIGAVLKLNQINYHSEPFYPAHIFSPILNCIRKNSVVVELKEPFPAREILQLFSVFHGNKITAYISKHFCISAVHAAARLTEPYSAILI